GRPQATPRPPPHEYFFASPKLLFGQLPGARPTHVPPAAVHAMGPPSGFEAASEAPESGGPTLMGPESPFGSGVASNDASKSGVGLLSSFFCPGSVGWVSLGVSFGGELV